MDNELASLFHDDRRDHADVPPVGTPEYRALRERDRIRRRKVAELATLGLIVSAEDQYRAAWVLNHGDTTDDALQAHRLALESAEMGHRPARWLAAATYDRWRMYRGEPQKYGTQFVPDGTRERLWDVEEATTDAERDEWDVPPLAEQLRKAEQASRDRSPTPIGDDAPRWLREVLDRWGLERPASVADRVCRGDESRQQVGIDPDDRPDQ